MPTPVFRQFSKLSFFSHAAFHCNRGQPQQRTWATSPPEIQSCRNHSRDAISRFFNSKLYYVYRHRIKHSNIAATKRFLRNGKELALGIPDC